MQQRGRAPFLVIFMLRSWRFIHSQQLCPLGARCITIGWQAIIGDLSWSAVLSNAGDTDPSVVTIGVFAIVMSILAAKNLNKELVSAHRQVTTCSLFL